MRAMVEVIELLRDDPPMGDYERRMAMMNAKLSVLGSAADHVVGVLGSDQLRFEEYGESVVFCFRGPRPANVPEEHEYEWGRLCVGICDDDDFSLLPDGSLDDTFADYAVPTPWKAAVLDELIALKWFTGKREAEFLDEALRVFRGELIHPNGIDSKEVLP